jgi:hypothetical protein
VRRPKQWHILKVPAANSSVVADLRLRVLYVSPNSMRESGKEAIAERGHDVVAGVC